MPTGFAGRRTSDNSGPLFAIEILSRQDMGMKQDYIYLEEYLPEKTTHEIASCIGQTVSFSGISDIQRLCPQKACDSNPNTYSGIFGTGEFPLHTDLAHYMLPPHYLLIRCIKPGTDVQTGIISFRNAITGISRNDLQRARFRSRRRVHKRYNLVQFLKTVDYDSQYRWDQLFLIPDNQAAANVSETLSSLKTSDSDLISLKGFSDVLIIDNWKSLHCRTSVPDSAMDRILERVYLSEVNI